MIMRNKNISLFIGCIALIMMITCICGLFTSEIQNDSMLALTGFGLSTLLAGLAIWDYDNLTKKQK